MPAIKSHSTATDDRAWDASANVANARSGEDRAYYARIFAWRDSDKDETTKGAYKFPHHFVSADGDPGAASIKGCQSGIGVLNGAMGGADIPSGDRQGVYNHLARHLQDAEIEPADLRALWEIQPAIERRALIVPEWRVIRDGGDDIPRIEAHAAIFDVESDDLGGFVEIVHPGAFAKTIQEADIRALVNHNPDRVLGRNRAGTLALAEDERGLRFVVWPPDATWANDVLVSIERGDVNQGSFGFETIRDEWEQKRGGRVIRHLWEAHLFDVSVVTFPAYPQTSAEVRARAAEFQTTAPGLEAHAGGDGDIRISRGRRSLWRVRLELARRGRYGTYKGG